MAEVAVAREMLEQKMGKQLGDAVDPLLVSVRSGAPFSMPGMMDTVLNLGLNDDSVKGLAKQTGNERFAYDSYRRFVQMFGKIVLDVPGDLFEEALHDLVEAKQLTRRHRARPRPISPVWSRRSRASSARKRASSSRSTRSSSSATRSKPCSSRGTASARGLPPHGEDRRRPRHRGERADDGVRQQGRRLRHRRRVHAQPVDR